LGKSAVEDEATIRAREQHRTYIRGQRRVTGATGILAPPVKESLVEVRSRKVDDPSMSDSEYLYQRAKRPENPDIGKVWATENALTRIGALCYVRRRERHHEKAAEVFKAMYEALYGCGSPAMDASRVQVDTSPIAHDSGMAAKIDRGWRIAEAIKFLGEERANRIIACVVLCIKCEDGADVMPSGERNRRQVMREVTGLLSALDMLAGHWGFGPVPS
jgi:hypothetical protein